MQTSLPGSIGPPVKPQSVTTLLKLTVRSGPSGHLALVSVRARPADGTVRFPRSHHGNTGFIARPVPALAGLDRATRCSGVPMLRQGARTRRPGYWLPHWRDE